MGGSRSSRSKLLSNREKTVAETCEHWTSGTGYARASLYAACPWCEIERLRALLTQAPIAKVTVREGCMANAPDDVYVKLYAPGLPPGKYDLYLMPEVPSGQHPSTGPAEKA